jgi:hypothetical protein
MLVINWASPPNCLANEYDDAAVGTAANITAIVVSNRLRFINLATKKTTIGKIRSLRKFAIIIGVIDKEISLILIFAPIHKSMMGKAAEPSKPVVS